MCLCACERSNSGISRRGEGEDERTLETVLVTSFTGFNHKGSCVSVCMYVKGNMSRMLCAGEETERTLKSFDPFFLDLETWEAGVTMHRIKRKVIVTSLVG